MLSHMSRTHRDTPAGGVEPTPPSTPSSAPPATPRDRPRTRPKLSKRPKQPRTSALASLAVATAQSQRRSPSDPATDPGTAPGAEVPAEHLARTYALTQTPPTEAQAYEFAKLLRSGVPQPDALAYIVGPGLDPHTTHSALTLWLRSPAVRDALALLNGGAWPALAPEARLDVALDKHYAEMAYYLYTHDYDQATGPELRKLDTAREALEQQRTGRLQQNSPFMKFLTAILKPGADLLRLGNGESSMPGDNRPTMALGLADVEPAVDGQVVETRDEGA